MLHVLEILLVGSGSTNVPICFFFSSLFGKIAHGNIFQLGWAKNIKNTTLVGLPYWPWEKKQNT